jgi:hypothetical protein
MKADAPTPSMGRSFGTKVDAPTIPASVGSQSTAASIWSVTTPPGTFPGQRIMAGTRMLPSNGVLKKSPRQGPFEPGPVCGIVPPLALSLLKMKIVLSSMPASLTASKT